MKARWSHKNSTPHGGIIPILKKIKEFGIPQVIRKSLGERKVNSKYRYDDIFIAWILTSFCGGKRLDHITKVKKKLSIIPNLKIPSHDTLGRAMKKVATETLTDTIISNDKNAKIRKTDYNDNIKANRMLVKATKRMGTIKEGPSYTLDIDATFISTECRGAIRKVDRYGKLEYSKIGFNPMICLIGDNPVYISMRNGDAGARFRLNECVQNCLRLMDESKIKIGRIISDAAGYNKEMMEMIAERGIKFNIRFPYKKNMLSFKSELDRCHDWRPTEIETANFIWKCEIADIPYTMHESKTWRVVAIRIPTEATNQRINTNEENERRRDIKKKLHELSKRKVLKEMGKPYEDKNWKKIDGYLYKFFITNDFEKTSEGIINEYNKRGNAERKFSFLKNDFGWRLPPFMNMNENTVFMIAAALANNIFRGIVKLFKKTIPALRLNARLPDFIFEFISVGCSYVNRFFEFDNSDINYVDLM